MSSTRAYIVVAVVTTMIVVAVLLIADSRSLWVIIPLVGVLVFFPRQWLAKRLTRMTTTR